jgi:alcohol dehydrogenase (cytochrome c)
MTQRTWIGLAGLLAALAVPVSVGVQSGGARQAGAKAEWLTVGGDWGNTRYSGLDQITAQNAMKLGGAWKSAKFDTSASTRAMPIVRNGVMYVTVPPNVYALNAKTGETIWRFQGGGGRGRGAGPARMGSPAREGVALGEGLVFVGLSDARVLALNDKTGEIVWNKYVGDNPRDKGQVISGAALYAGGLVTVGLSADNGWRGQVVALNPKTGDEAWRFYAIPAPAEKGHETWPQNSDIYTRGGGAIWLAGAADADLNTIYYVTGNGVPQLGGEGRPGDNLFLCSVVALDMKTGKLKWHYQVIHHDVWEADIAISPVLFEAQAGGAARKGIAAMRADGYLFLLDRETGKPLSKVEERAVPQDALQKSAATQPFPIGADRALPDCAEWKTRQIPKGFEVGCFFTPASVQKPNILAPNYGMRVAPMAYSPQTGFFYAAGVAGLTWLRRAEDPSFFSSFNGRVPGINSLDYGVLAAIDSRTNKIAWKKEYPHGRPSGPTATAGGLLFVASSDRTLDAYDAKSGNVVWQFNLGASGGPPTVYEIDGEQYVATLAGGNVWAFKIGGTIPAAAPAKFSPEERFTGPIVDTAAIETASLQKDRGFIGTRYFTDDYAFEPYRARVKAGTQVTWRNNSRLPHTIVAEDGSWTTGRLSDGAVGAKVFDKPGTYTYICKEHPWAYAQIIVTE